MEQKEQALKQMDGRTTAVYAKWRTELVSCLAHLEAVVDFAEDEDDVGEKHILSEGAKFVTAKPRNLIAFIAQCRNGSRLFASA